MNQATTAEPGWVEDVIRFWLVETLPQARFKRDDALDAEIARRFATVHAEVLRRSLTDATATPRVALATVIVLDQFPRNMFRGTPEVFASDAAALGTARAALDAGLDTELDPGSRLFLYLPFEHSEELADQARAVALIAQLGNAELDRYAVAHRDIIARFGRFPHRNPVLGRTSTPEEIEFLSQPGSSF